MRLPHRVPEAATVILLACWISTTAFGQATYPQQPPYPQPYPQQPQGYPQSQPYPQTQGYPQQGYPPQGYPQQQGYPQAAPPPYFPPQQLASLVSRVALYPDPLLAQVFAAATFYDQIPSAAQYADQHRNMPPPALAGAIQADQVPWDPSVQALLPFPNILDMMASDPNWTQQMGTAFLAQQPDVMAAVQNERQIAYRYGYLRSNPQVVVTSGPYIAIAPVNPGFVVVPVYNPAVVFVAPRPGFFVGGAVNFGFGVSIGAAFRPWGWGVTNIGWANRTVIVNNAPWGRNWANRAVYVHPYVGVPRQAFRPGPVVGVRPGGPVGRPVAPPAARPGVVAPQAARPAPAPAPGRRAEPSSQNERNRKAPANKEEERQR